VLRVDPLCTILPVEVRPTPMKLTVVMPYVDSCFIHTRSHRSGLLPFLCVDVQLRYLKMFYVTKRNQILIYNHFYDNAKADTPSGVRIWLSNSSIYLLYVMGGSSASPSLSTVQITKVSRSVPLYSSRTTSPPTTLLCCRH
jgi:hypothetical protein